MEFKNVSRTSHNIIHANNYEFYEELNLLVKEEHEDAIDDVRRGRLALLGIVKGETFNPDEKCNYKTITNHQGHPV